MKKTILMLRGPISYQEALTLSFMSEHDAVVDLVAYSTAAGDLRTAEGCINPYRNSTIVQGSLQSVVRRQAIDEALKLPEADLVIAMVPGLAYKKELAHAQLLLREGHRVLWAFIGAELTPIKARARLVPGVEIIELVPHTAWSKLCGALGIHV